MHQEVTAWVLKLSCRNLGFELQYRRGHHTHSPCYYDCTTGFIIAFSIAWDMALVMVGCLPFLAIMGGFIARVGRAHALQEQSMTASSTP